MSFGLVNIPNRALSGDAKRGADVSVFLRQYNLSPVNYKRVAEKDGKEVPWNQIVKGYEVQEKGKYVVLKDEDFQRVDLEATQTVDIQRFCRAGRRSTRCSSTDLTLFEPQKGGDKAYVLLSRDAEENGQGWNQEGGNKDAAITSDEKTKKGRVLVLELMHFAEELTETE